MSRLRRLSPALVVIALMMVTASACASTDSGSASTDKPASTDNGPKAQASGRCRVGNDRGYGTTYVRSISASGVSCRRAREIVRAFHRCRKGARGRCGRTNRFRCRENRSVGVGSFDSNVTCRRGGKRVRHSYTQFT